MEAFGELLWLVFTVIVCGCIGVGVGILIGYFVGRSAGRREFQRGFAVLPHDSSHPA